ncbi:MAG TPA: hypothetical protein VKU00_14935 [Chthonomonadaceae bacterium]|nr:hypothetical protein [Chthonomonadaceae bacterium]
MKNTSVLLLSALAIALVFSCLLIRLYSLERQVAKQQEQIAKDREQIVVLWETATQVPEEFKNVRDSTGGNTSAHTFLDEDAFREREY